MRWLHDNGLISRYDDYFDLPLSVIEDARLIRNAQATAATVTQGRGDSE